MCHSDEVGVHRRTIYDPHADTPVLRQRQGVFFFQELVIVSLARLEGDMVMLIHEPDAHVLHAAPRPDQPAGSIQIFLSRVLLREKLEQRVGNLCPFFSFLPKFFIR